jgi:hypothetical protein
MPARGVAACEPDAWLESCKAGPAPHTDGFDAMTRRVSPNPLRAPEQAGLCTVVASVYKTNPVGLTYTAGLPPEVAAHLQAVAWETSQAFHANAGRGSL